MTSEDWSSPGVSLDPYIGLSVHPDVWRIWAKQAELDARMIEGARVGKRSWNREWRLANSALKCQATFFAAKLSYPSQTVVDPGSRSMIEQMLPQVRSGWYCSPNGACTSVVTDGSPRRARPCHGGSGPAGTDHDLSLWKTCPTDSGRQR